MSTTEDTADREIVSTRLIDAPVARVWRAWADNDEIVKWWGPHGFSDETASREFKEGGIWKHVMIGPDGARYLNTAKYVEIVPEKRIVVKTGAARSSTRRAWASPRRSRSRRSGTRPS